MQNATNVCLSCSWWGVLQTRHASIQTAYAVRLQHDSLVAQGLVVCVGPQITRAARCIAALLLAPLHMKTPMHSLLRGLLSTQSLAIADLRGT